jgi:hypothetical protein
METLNNRERDIQKVCRTIIEFGVEDTGDYGMGGECPFCRVSCKWNDSLEDVKHDLSCVYLIAKDLLTK